MAKLTGLPDLGHDWKPVRVDDGPLQYDCRCLAPRSPVPHRDSFCPDAVLDYANRLVAEEQEKTRALLEGLREKMRARAQVEGVFARHDRYAGGLAWAYGQCAGLLTEALDTLEDR